ncbi:MAG: PIG-L family deacetylase [Anaerolineae bacterium]|nr:PIG-L family deacetylase [Anaerolineae bacterium]
MTTILTVLAHPDDETFGPGGTLAKYAAQGVAVHLVCATRGEAGGSDLEDLSDCEDLACRREEELRCAVKTLGISELHLLGYRDSGMAGTPSNQHPDALIQADPQHVAEQIAQFMRQLRPEVVVTFDPYGAYGHPDHIAMHRATVAAIESLPSSEQPAKLYFHTIPYTALRWAVRLLPLFGVNPEAVGRNKDINLRDILRHKIPVTTSIDISSTYDVKERAAQCHSSQLSGSGSVWGRLPEWLVKRMQSTDTFHRARPAFETGERREHDLLAGLK